jgi:hypothetical protein
MVFIDAASMDLQTAIGEVISGSANRLGRRGVGWTIFLLRSDLFPASIGSAYEVT